MVISQWLVRFLWWSRYVVLCSVGNMTGKSLANKTSLPSGESSGSRVGGVSDGNNYLACFQSCSLFIKACGLYRYITGEKETSSWWLTIWSMGVRKLSSHVFAHQLHTNFDCLWLSFIRFFFKNLECCLLNVLSNDLHFYEL